VATVREHESLLVERFVASFEKLDDMTAWDHDSVACQLVTGDPNQFGHRRWQPTKVDTDLEMLEPIYSKLPARFPPIFERLVSFVSVGRNRSAVVPLASEPTGA